MLSKVQNMEKRFIKNPFPDFMGEDTATLTIDEEYVKNLICTYVDEILQYSRPALADEDKGGDLYVGNGGIAYMFWKMSRSEKAKHMYPSLDHAYTFIRSAKINITRYKKQNSIPYAFLCGNAGIYAVSAAISHDLHNNDELANDLSNFKLGVGCCNKPIQTKNGCNEILVGRAGYLAGCYWLNDVLKEKKISDDDILSVCKMMLSSGREYAKKMKSPIPLMYHYHGTQYLGAAHGLSSILLMLLDSPWFSEKPITASNADLRDIKRSLDYFLSIQDDEGNFPVSMEELKTGNETRLVHWCHGAPGVAYLLAKAYLVFEEEKYLAALRQSADLIWKQGFLRKGPGICHGVAGNGYAFLLLYRLTKETKYLYRASKFMELLTSPDFQLYARRPDRPHSLYEGLAGTVCFLVDLLDPQRAQFPFMNVFH